jgi:ribosomal 30S subunit maturation factor RimM
MNPNNPDLDDLIVSLLANKRKRSESIVISSDDVVNDIKLVCIDRLIPFVKAFIIDVDLSDPMAKKITVDWQSDW